MDSEAEITLGLLNAVHENSAITQRSASKQLGIALGLTNAYLKRCIRKGHIKVRQIPSNRYAYYLTPRGFSEKARLTARYLSHSLSFFRQARRQCSEALRDCEAQGRLRVALAGVGELAEIATLCAREGAVHLVGVIDPDADGGAANGGAAPDGAAQGGKCAGLPVVRALSDLPEADAVLVTDLRTPQETYDRLRPQMPADRLLAPALLRIVDGPSAEGSGPQAGPARQEDPTE